MDGNIKKTTKIINQLSSKNIDMTTYKKRAHILSFESLWPKFVAEPVGEAGYFFFLVLTFG